MGMNAKVDTQLMKFPVASLSDFLSIFKNKWLVLLTLCLLGLFNVTVATANTLEQPAVEEGDAFWYDLTVSATGAVGVNAWTDGTTGRDFVLLYLYNPAGTKVDSSGGDFNKVSITYAAATTGTYKVKVYLKDAAGGGTRKISVSSPFSLSASPHYKETAIDVAGGDAVWYDLTVSSTGAVGVNAWTDGTTGYVKVYLDLYNPAGTVVDSNRGDYYYKDSISYAATTTGTYKVKVYLDDAAGGGTRKITTSSPYPLLGISATTPAPTTLTPTPAPTTPVPTTSVPTTPQQTGEITVYSDQKDATIYVDDKYAAITSGKSSQYSSLYYGTVSGLTIGTHTFKVTKTNYQEPPSQTVNVVTGSWQVNEKLFFYLEPISVSTLTPTPTVTKIPMVTTTAKTTLPVTRTPSPTTTSSPVPPAVVSVNERTATATFPSIATDQYATAQIPSKKEQAVGKITLYVKNNVDDAKLDIETLYSKPVEVKIDVPGEVYRYISINPQGIQSSDLYSAEIGFKIEKSWVTSNNIDPDTVALYRYKDGQWNRQSTAKLTEDSDYIYYSATTSGFSIFAISALPIETGINWAVMGIVGLILLGIVILFILRKKKSQIEISRTVYDPVTKDFVSEKKLHYPEVLKWLSAHPPPDYWYILRINNLGSLIEQWAVELETNIATSVKEAHIDGNDRAFTLREEHGTFKSKYTFSVLKEMGIPLPSNGIRRLFFRLNIDCSVALQSRYAVSGKVIANGVALIPEKSFPFSCQIKKLKEIWAKNPKEVEKYVDDRVREIYSLDAARAITDAFRLYNEINKLIDKGIDDKALKNKIENLRASLENVKKLTGMERPLRMVEESLAIMDISVEVIQKRWKSMNLFDVMMTELLKGRD